MGKEEDLNIVGKYQKEIVLLSRTLGLLVWDQETYMPKKGVESRAEKNSFLESSIHERITSDELFNAIKRLQKEDLNERERCMIRKLDKEVERAKKIPKDFVE